MKRSHAFSRLFTSILTVALLLSALFAGGSLFAQDNDSLFRRADSLYAAGIELYNEENYLAAAALFEQCDSLNKAGEREMPFYTSNAFHWAACSYIEAGDTVRAMAADSTYFMLPPVDQRLTVKSDSLSFIGNEYFWNDDFENALACYLQSAELEREVLGEDHYYYANSLYALGLCQYYLGNVDESIGTIERSLEIREAGCEEDPDIFAALFHLFYLCRQNEDYVKAVEYGVRMLELSGDPDWLDETVHYTFLVDLADSCDSVGDDETAVELETEALEVVRDVLGERHSDYAASLENLAYYYTKLGDDGKAVDLDLQVLDILIETEGEVSEGVARVYSNLNGLYSDMGEFDKALAAGLRALEIAGEVYGEDSPYYAGIMEDVAMLYVYIGFYDRAVEMQTKAVEIYGRAMGEMNEGYAGKLCSLVRVFFFMGEYDKAVEVGERALDILQKIPGGSDSYYYSTALNNLAMGCSQLGEIDRAIDYETMALEIRRELFGETSSPYAEAVNNLADLYGGKGDYAVALKMHEKVLEIHGKIMSERHPNYAYAYYNTAYPALYAGDQAKAVEYMAEFLRLTTRSVREKFAFLTAEGRSLYWNSVKSDIDDFTIFCCDTGGGESSALAYDAELLGKGILLSSEREFDKVIKESGDGELMAKFEQLRQDRQTLETYYMMDSGNRPEVEVERLEAEAKQLEKNLIAGSKEYGDFTKSLSIEWRDVRDRLGDRDVAVEYAVADYADDPYYFALILRKGWDCPIAVGLGSLSVLEPYLSLGSNDLYRSQAFSDAIWGDLEETAELEEGDNVYFAPEGVFYQVGVEYLPVGDGRIMADKYNIRRLSSTKELCMEPGEVADDSAVLYGGLIYEANPNTETTVEVATREETKQDLMVGRLLAERGAEADSLMRDNIKYLPGTLAETDTLATMLAQKEIAYKKYTGHRGTEESFKALTGNSPRLIHIATHGFYLSPTSAEIMSQREDGFKAGGNGGNGDATDLSMSRAGLLFAGAGPAWFGEPVPEDGDDGILTAKEIAGLDLRGTDLTVLSACSTASGEITGDGVAGLQRGFKKAGVKTLLLTLWEVNDRATQLFMTKFYENLTAGKSKRQAFEAAQSYLRTYEDWIEFEIDDPDGEPVYDDTIGDYVRPTKTVRELGRPYSAPQYWAAFIMLD